MARLSKKLLRGHWLHLVLALVWLPSANPRCVMKPIEQDHCAKMAAARAEHQHSGHRDGAERKAPRQGQSMPSCCDATGRCLARITPAESPQYTATTLAVLPAPVSLVPPAAAFVASPEPADSSSHGPPVYLRFLTLLI